MDESILKSSHWDSSIVNMVPYCSDDGKTERVEYAVAKAYAMVFAKICVDTQSNVFWKGNTYPESDTKRPNGKIIKAHSLTQEKNVISVHPLGYFDVTYMDKKDMSTYSKKFHMMYVSTYGANKFVMSEDDIELEDTFKTCELVANSKTKLFYKLSESFAKAFVKVLDDNPGKFTFATAQYYKTSNVKPNIVVEIQ